MNVLDGGDTVKISPHLGDLEFVNGTFPTKYGVLEISHTIVNGQLKTKIDTPKGLKIIQN